MRPLQHPSVIEHWSTAEWTRGWVLPARVMIGWVFPLLFAVETYRTVHETTSGFHALLAATLIFGIVYAVEAGYVLASGPLAEALGVVAVIAVMVRRTR